MADVNKLVIFATRNANDDKASVAFTIANAARSKGMDVGVFLTSDGVELARDGSCNQTKVQPFKGLDELIDSFIAAGGTIWACAPCYQHRGMREAENYDKVVVTGAGPMLDWIAQGAATISL